MTVWTTGLTRPRTGPPRAGPRARPRRSCATALFLAAALGAGPAAAQEARTDTLEARVRRLTALVDSLLAELGGREGAVAADTTGGLEALRAAADAAAAGAPAVDTAGGTSRTRNLNALNPEISVTGDVVGGWAAPGEGESGASAIPREFEFSFISALDPYARAKVFLSAERELDIAGLEDAIHMDSGLDETGEEEGEEHGEEEHGGIELEEAYAQFVGLPGNLGLKLGQFRQELGLYNRWHTHALLEVERPLATVAFLGDHGLIQTGASLALPGFQLGPATQTVVVEVARADNPLFEGGTDLSYLGRLQSFVELGAGTFLQLGVNGLTGDNDEADLTSRLFGVDAYFRWAPPARSLYRELTLKGEWYWVDRDVGPVDLDGSGGWAQASYRWDRRWITGLRADYLDGFGDEPTAWALVPSVTYWQSEWVRFRLQYDFIKQSGLDGHHTVMLQTVFAVGPHKHETY